MKYKFKEYTQNICILTNSEGVETHYRGNENGYVYDISKNKQVCDELGYTGPTLFWTGKEPLIELIRKEHKKRQRRKG